MRLLKGGWAAKRFQGPALPWAGLLLVLLAASAVGVELLVKGLPANHSLYGDAKARWTINEYADLECPFCKVYTPRLKRWVDSHPDVNLVWRHLPLQMHGEAARHMAGRLAMHLQGKMPPNQVHVRMAVYPALQPRCVDLAEGALQVGVFIDRPARLRIAVEAVVGW